MKLTIFIILSVCLLFSCKPNSNQTSKNQQALLTDSLTLELDEIYKQGFINGYGVAIVNQNGIIYQNAFGYADVKNGKEYTVNTIQNIASVSKTLLALALLKAQEMGKLSLDDPIRNYLPFEVINPHFPDDTITVRHLATHTSTITDTELYGNKSYILKNNSDIEKAKSIQGAEEFNSPNAYMSMNEFLQNFLSKEGEWYQEDIFLKKQPGALYEYSNVGATLAAYIVELATNQNYSDFTTQYILNPLGMSSSGWSFNSVDLNLHSKLYADLETELPFYSLITYPDGGLITSINDMGKYLSELIKGCSGEGELLTKESYDKIFKEQLVADNFEERDTDRPFDDEYNAGIFMGFTPIGYIGHMGGDPGVSTFMFFNPKSKVGRLLFVNTGLNENGVKQFYTTWDKLGEYETKLNEKADNNQ